MGPLDIQVAQAADPVTHLRKATVANKLEGETFKWQAPIDYGFIDGSTLVSPILMQHEGQEAYLKVVDGRSICYFTCLSQRPGHEFNTFPLVPAGQGAEIPLP